MKHEVETMITRISEAIAICAREYNSFGRSKFYELQFSKVCGMCEMLNIATGSEYYFDENGLHEREPKAAAAEKRVLKIDGYTIDPVKMGCHSIMVMTTDNCVVEFSDLNRAEYPVLLHAIENDDNVEKYVVADFYGAFIYGETDIIREGDAAIAAEPATEPTAEPATEPTEPAKNSTTGLYSIRAIRKNARRNSRNPYEYRGVVWANSETEARDRVIARFYNGTVPENIVVDATFWGDIVYTF